MIVINKYLSLFLLPGMNEKAIEMLQELTDIKYTPAVVCLFIHTFSYTFRINISYLKN